MKLDDYAALFGTDEAADLLPADVAIAVTQEDRLEDRHPPMLARPAGSPPGRIAVETAEGPSAAGVLVHPQVLQHERVQVLGQPLHDEVTATRAGRAGAAGIPRVGKPELVGNGVE